MAPTACIPPAWRGRARERARFEAFHPSERFRSTFVLFLFSFPPPSTPTHSLFLTFSPYFKSHILSLYLSFSWPQCDQMSRNFAILAKSSKSWANFWGFISYLRKFGLTSANFVYHWASFQWCKWPNVGNNLAIWSRCLSLLYYSLTQTLSLSIYISVSLSHANRLSQFWMQGGGKKKKKQKEEEAHLTDNGKLDKLWIQSIVENRLQSSLQWQWSWRPQFSSPAATEIFTLLQDLLQVKFWKTFLKTGLLFCLWNRYSKFCRWLALNGGPLVFETTALPT